MTSIRLVEVDTELTIVDESTDLRRSAFAPRAHETGVDSFWQAFKVWLVDSRAPYKRTRRTGMHVRRRGEN